MNLLDITKPHLKHRRADLVAHYTTLKSAHIEATGIHILLTDFELGKNSLIHSTLFEQLSIMMSISSKDQRPRLEHQSKLPKNLKVLLLQQLSSTLLTFTVSNLNCPNLIPALPLLHRLTDTLLSFVLLTLIMTKPIKLQIHHKMNCQCLPC